VSRNHEHGTTHTPQASGYTKIPIERAAAIVADYCERFDRGADSEEVLIDVLTDLMHFSDAEMIDWREVSSLARLHHVEDRNRG
jgi:hypothetical protein